MSHCNIRNFTQCKDWEAYNREYKNVRKGQIMQCTAKLETQYDDEDLGMSEWKGGCKGIGTEGCSRKRTGVI